MPTTEQTGGEMTERTCSVEGCDQLVRCKGLCGKHYTRLRTRGTTAARTVPNEVDRFWAKVDRHGPVSEYRPDLGPCWLWTGYLHKGYGRFVVGGRKVLAHRFSYEAHRGPTDDDLDHLCRVRACCNPAHVEPVTKRENTMRSPIAPAAVNARKTHCKRGHEFTPENTIRQSSGGRACRACVNAARRAQRRAARVLS